MSKIEYVFVEKIMYKKRVVPGIRSGNRARIWLSTHHPIERLKASNNWNYSRKIPNNTTAVAVLVYLNSFYQLNVEFFNKKTQKVFC